MAIGPDAESSLSRHESRRGGEDILALDPVAWANAARDEKDLA